MSSQKIEVDELNKIIAERLRIARKMADLTLQQAATKLGTTKGALSKKESKDRESRQACKMHFLVQCADLYNVTIDFLVGRSVYPEGDVLQSQVATGIRCVEKVMEENLADIAKMAMEVGLEQSKFVPLANELIKSSEASCNAMNGFITRNRDEFEEMPWGAKVMSSNQRLMQVIKRAKTTRDRWTSTHTVSSELKHGEVVESGSQLLLVSEYLKEEIMGDVDA